MSKKSGSGAVPIPVSRPTLRPLAALQAIARWGIAALTPASPFIRTDALRRVTDGATPQDRITSFIEERVHMPLTEPQLSSDPDTRQPLLYGGQHLRPMARPCLRVSPAALAAPLFDRVEDGTIE